MLNIYSIGDINFLATILNSIAAWAGTSHPAQLAATGAIIGVFTLCVQSLMSAKGPQFQNFLVGILFYWFLMGPGVGVTIHDVYSGVTQNVANVPFGVAAVGSIMSTVGYSITEKMEQMFSTPGMSDCMSGTGVSSECGFLTGIKFTGLPAIDLYLPGITSLPAAQQGNVKKTILNYVRNCTYAGLSLNQLTIERIMNNPDPWAALGYPSDIYGTLTFIPVVDPQVGTNRTCSDAYTQIGTYLNGTSFWDHIRPHLQAVTGIAGDPLVVGQEILQATANATSTPVENIYHVYQAKILGPLFESGIDMESLVRYNMTSGDLSAAQAKAQRNEQWYGEKRLFQTTIRPAMTFFEGFFYALTPFMAFAIMIVPFGLKMIIRYLQTAVWIQVWMPMMSIINLFAYMAYFEEFSALKVAQVSSSSLRGVIAVQSSATDWIAQANLLGSMVPALAMMVVYGSSVALTHMAAQLKGGDHWDEKLRAPDVVKVPPLNTYTDAGGINRGGSAPPTISMRNEAGNAVNSTFAENVASTQALQGGISNMITAGANQNTSAGTADLVRESARAGHSESSKTVLNVANAMNQSMGGDSVTRDALIANLSGMGGLGIGGGKGSAAQFRAGMDAKLTKVFGEENSDKFSTAIKAGTDASGSNSISAAFEESVALDHSENRNSVLAVSYGTQADESLREVATKAHTSSEAYSQAQSNRKALSTSLNNNVLQLAGKVDDNSYTPALAKAYERAGLLNGGFAAKVNSFSRQYNASNDDSARAVMLLGLDQASGAGNVGAGNDLLSIVAGVDGLDYGTPMTSGTRNQGASNGAEGAVAKTLTDPNTGGERKPNGVNASQVPDMSASIATVAKIPTANVTGAYNGYVGEHVQPAADQNMATVAGMAGEFNTEKMRDNLFKTEGVAEATHGAADKQATKLGNYAAMARFAISDVGHTLAGGVAAGKQEVSPEEMALYRAEGLFSSAVEAGAATPEGRKFVERGKELVGEAMAGMEQMHSGGIMDKTAGAYNYGVAKINQMLNNRSLAQIGSFDQDNADDWNARSSRMDSEFQGIMSPTQMRGHAYDEAKHQLGFTEPQANLYADVKTAFLRNEKDPTLNAQNESWNVDSLSTHEFDRDSQGNRIGEGVKDDLVVRSVMRATTGNQEAINNVKGYNMINENKYEAHTTGSENKE